MLILYIFLTIFLLLLLGYIIILVKIHDFGLPKLDLESFLGNKESYKVLLIYPHPDDETMSSGGLMSMLAVDDKCAVKVVSTSYGERGDKLLKLPPEELMKVRADEFKLAMEVLGITDHEIWDIGDGEHQFKMYKLKKHVEDLIKEYKPDLVITYEKSGVYGHADHIALAKVVTELHQEMASFKVLYNTLAKGMFERIELPYYMCSGKDDLVQTDAEFKLNIVYHLNRKYSAAKKYKSQDLTQGKPLFIFKIMGIYEYYTSNYPE